MDWNLGRINIRRGWSKGKEADGKTAGSMTQVVMHPVLAQFLRDWRLESVHSKDSDWMFPSLKKKGKIPRVASCASQDYLRPAAVKAGVIPEGYKGRFGWHNLRHSLATFLASNVDLKTAQSILRHKRLSTTAEIYAHAVHGNQLAAQGQYLEAIKLKPISGAVQ